MVKVERGPVIGFSIFVNEHYAGWFLPTARGYEVFMPTGEAKWFARKSELLAWVERIFWAKRHAQKILEEAYTNER